MEHPPLEPAPRIGLDGAWRSPPGALAYANAVWLARAGRYADVVALLCRELERFDADSRCRFHPLRERKLHLRLAVASCRARVGQLGQALEESQSVLRERALAPELAFRACLVYAIGAAGLGAHGLALLATEQVAIPAGARADRLRADRLALRAVIFDRAGQNRKARALYRRARQLYACLGERFEHCKVLVNLAAATLAAGRPAAAIRVLDAAQSLAAARGYTRLEALIWAVRGRAVRHLERARRCLARSTALAERCGFESLARANAAEARALGRARFERESAADPRPALALRETPDPW